MFAAVWEHFVGRQASRRWGRSPSRSAIEALSHCHLRPLRHLAGVVLHSSLFVLLSSLFVLYEYVFDSTGSTTKLRIVPPVSAFFLRPFDVEAVMLGIAWALSCHTLLDK